MKYALRFIEDELPGVYVKSVQIGSSISEVNIISEHEHRC